MSGLAQPDYARAGQPANINLGSNNPFRNRTISPSLPSPIVPPPRPVSRNPFLDTSAPPVVNMSSPEKSPFLDQSEVQPPKSPLLGHAAELFDQLLLDTHDDDDHGNRKVSPSEKALAPRRDLHPSSSRPLVTRASTADVQQRSQQQPPPYTAIKSENVNPAGHRASRSQEEAMRARRAVARTSSKAQEDELDIFADEKSSARQSPRPRERRRNSESSVTTKTLDPEEETKRRDRRKERERRHRERSEGKPRKGRLDIIDQLDATSIYGTGLFHHDGPFDACNPNRNRQGSRRAPMQAFPKGSLNNALGGGGPVHKQPNHDAFLMRNGEDAFNDFAQGSYESGRGVQGQSEANVMSSLTRVEPIHGDESLGLGTSTFLEGAPASRAALVRKEAEAREFPSDGGLGRKKSLAQKFRGINSRREHGGPSGRISSLDGGHGALGSPESPLYTPGGHKHETNPFFNEFSKGDDTLTTPTTETASRARAPSSPKRFGEGTMERRMTGDGGANGDGSRPAGFLNRVKSLKGGARKAPPRPMPEPTAM